MVAESLQPVDFWIEIRRQADQKLGVDVDSAAEDSKLLITAVKQGGVVAAWNSQFPTLPVQPGDYFVEVNGRRGSAALIKAEVKASTYMRIGIQRAGLNAAPSLLGGLAVNAIEEEGSEQWEDLAVTSAPVAGLSDSCVDYSALPTYFWMLVVRFLYIHDNLGRLIQLSTRHLALLADESFLESLALPHGPSRMEKLLRVLLAEERDLWAWPLLNVKRLDLDATDACWDAVDLLEQLMSKSLDAKETLCDIRLRGIPVIPKGVVRSGNNSAFRSKLVTLVNPVIPSFPAGSTRPNFLLLPASLGSFRLRLAAFGHFRLEVSREASGQPMWALDLRARRCALDLPDGYSAEFDLQATSARRLLEVELGSLRELPKCEILVSEDFEDWSDRMVSTYCKLLRDAAPASLGGAQA